MADPSREIRLWKKLFHVTEMVRNYHTRNANRGDRPDITMTQVQIIGCVLFSPEQKARLRDISEDLGITPGGVSQQVENLVQLGFLERKEDENDRRAVCITLSEKGKQRNRELDAFFTGLFHKLLDDVPQEKCRIFLEVLEKMIEVLEKEKQLKKNNLASESKRVACWKENL